MCYPGPYDCCPVCTVTQSSTNILITGGTGFLGQHLVRAVLERGDRVAMVGRNFATAGPLLAAGATPVVADLRDRAAIVAACARQQVVIHAGALSAPWGKPADFHAINVGGTDSIL